MDMFGDEDDAVDALTSRAPFSEMVKPPTRSDGPGILVEGSPDVMAKLARCCLPVPGDDIFGFVTRGGGVSVHRSDCTNADKLRQESARLIDVSWDRGSHHGASMATMQLEALDKQGLLAELTRVLNDQKLPVIAFNHHCGDDHIATVRFTFQVSDTKQLGALMNQIRNIEGVFDVYRVTA